MTGLSTDGSTDMADAQLDGFSDDVAVVNP